MPLVNLFPFCLSIVMSEAVVHTSSTTDSFSGKVKNQYSSMNNLCAAVYSWMKGRAQLLPQFTKRWWVTDQNLQACFIAPSNFEVFGKLIFHAFWLLPRKQSCFIRGSWNHEMIIHETFYWNHEFLDICKDLVRWT